MIKTSSDLQHLVLTSVFHDPNLLGNVIDDIPPNFFSDNSLQFIYKALYGYYKKYGRVPTETEMHVLINQVHRPGEGNLADVVEDLETIFKSRASNPAFVITSIETFVKRAQFEQLLSEAAQKSESDKEYTIDGLMEEFLNAYNYQVTDVDCMRLDDFEKYEQIKEDLFGSLEEGTKIIKSCLPTLNQKLTYKGYKPTDLISVVAAPGVGKTAFLINEGLTASLQGFNVLTVYLGDMNEVTSANRYMACLTGFPISTFSLDKNSYRNMVVNNPQISQMKIFERIYNTRYAPGEISADKLRAIIYKLQTKYNIHFDLIIVDYADNLEQERDDMYQNGGQIYNKLKSLAVLNKSVVITASQPKIAYYDSEVIPFEGIAESSKKLHVVDVLLSIGKPARSAKVATMHLAKIRDGVTGDTIKLGLDLDVGKIKEITDEAYNAAKSQLYENQVTKSVKPKAKDE